MNLENFELAFAKLQFDLNKRAMIYTKIASFSKQGTPVFDTIEMFAEAYGKKGGDARAPILKRWIESMTNGDSFSQAIEGFAPESEIMLIAAGEANGDLAGGMKKALFVTKAISDIRSAIIGGLSYSLILILTLCGMITMFSIKVIPEMVAIMPIEKWPEVSKGLYHMSTFVKEYGAYVGIGFVLFLIISMKTLGVFKGKIRKVFDYLPPWSVYKAVQSAIFLITLSSMMNAGIQLNNALQKIKDLSPPYIKEFIDEMQFLLSVGEGNGDILDVGLLDYDTALDIKLLGRTADFQSSMMMIGEDSIGQTIKKINVITKMIGTGVLFMIAGFVIFVYTGFFTLTQAIADQAQNTH